MELFNQKPKQGIAYLQEHGYLDKSHDSIVHFLKETPNLNKTLIGEYISRKDNPRLTETYVKYDLIRLTLLAYGKPVRLDTCF